MCGARAHSVPASWQGTNFPWRPQPVWDILASAAKINVAGGGEGTLSKESHKYYGCVAPPHALAWCQASYVWACRLFFGGAWADPVKQFVPKLRELYNAVNSREANSFEVIYVPSDQKEDQYTAFVDKYPWLALPFRTGLKPKLSLKYVCTQAPLCCDPRVTIGVCLEGTKWIASHDLSSSTERATSCVRTPARR